MTISHLVHETCNKQLSHCTSTNQKNFKIFITTFYFATTGFKCEQKICLNMVYGILAKILRNKFLFNLEIFTNEHEMQNKIFRI